MNPELGATQDFIQNRTFDEIRIGDTASLTRTLKAEDLQLFAAMAGSDVTSQFGTHAADVDLLPGSVARSMWAAALISTLLGNDYPGPGTVYVSQALRFLGPVCVGDTFALRVTVTARDADTRHVTLDCRCTDAAGTAVIDGQVVVRAAVDRIRYLLQAPMQARLSGGRTRHAHLLSLARGLAPIAVAVVHPCSEDALRGALEAAELGLIVPILVGPEIRIRATAASAGIALGPVRIVDTLHSHAAAAKAVEMARAGEVQALMKGSLHTDELMAEVVKPVDGLRTERRISHVYVLDVPSYPKPLLITDAAINVEPDLAAKRDIVQNAIRLAHALGIAAPKVAILAAVETVNPKMRSTLDAAALCKMADRGQISGAVLDGPLAFDNAISERAAKDKGIVSAVAGRADILVAPDLEAGNMMAKQLQYLAGAQAAGVVLGARVPVILTSRADEAAVRVASCALALLLVQADAKGAGAVCAVAPTGVLAAPSLDLR